MGRELRLPTVVATRTASSVLRDGEIVTVDGTAGEVREGRPDRTRISVSIAASKVRLTIARLSRCDASCAATSWPA